MKAKLSLIILITSALAMSCSSTNESYNESQLIGNWQEIMPEGNTFVKCMILNENGKASSIGTTSIQYNSWQLENSKKEKSKIILTCISTENGTPESFTDTLSIISLANDTLITEKWGDYQIKFVKRENINVSFDNPDKLEGAICVHSTTNNDPNIKGYLVFSKDSSTVDVFLPEITVTLDKRIKDDGSSVWNIEDDDTYIVTKNNNKWLVSRRNTLLYSSQE